VTASDVTTQDASEANLLFVVAPAGPKTYGADNDIGLAWRVYCYVRNADGSTSVYQSFSTTIHNIQSEPVYGTGGHLTSHQGSKPHGGWEPSSGTLSPDGRFYTMYTADVASGDELITMTYTPHDTPCTGITDQVSYATGVRIRGLVRADPVPNLTLAAIGSNHSDIYYATPEARAALYRLADAYHAATEGRDYVRVTAIALPFGGINDVGNNWRPPHSTHRVGTDVDVDGANDSQQTHFNLIRAGERAAFRLCERHGPRGAPNHVHCYYGPRYTD
jgi:hypothetical protein